MLKGPLISAMSSTLSKKNIIKWAREHILMVLRFSVPFSTRPPHLFAQTIAEKNKSKYRFKKKKKNCTHIHPHTQSPMGQACVCACARFTHILVDKEGTIKQWTCEQFVVCLCVCTMLVGVHTRWLDMSNDIPQRQTLVIKKMR